jgi:nitroimidazol reductase NimA-like FMN-containing flavoprotein (pyridoxamine 5'-phosphate oxidase superfamily)
MKPNPTPEQNRSHVNIILKKALFCHLGMSINDMPYVVTVNFGYDDKYIYFHSNQKGKKVEMIASNPNVCFELNYGGEVFSNQQSCNWGTKYRSVIGYGKAELLKSDANKKKGLLAIMYKYSSSKEHEFNEHVLAHTNVYRINRKNTNAKNNHWYWTD